MVVSGSAGVWSAWLEGYAGGGGGTRPLTGVEGCVLEPTPVEMAALHAGAAYLNVRAADNVTEVLRTRIPQVHIKTTPLKFIQNVQFEV